MFKSLGHRDLSCFCVGVVLCFIAMYNERVTVTRKILHSMFREVSNLSNKNSMLWIKIHTSWISSETFILNWSIGRVFSLSFWGFFERSVTGQLLTNGKGNGRVHVASKVRLTNGQGWKVFLYFLLHRPMFVCIVQLYCCCFIYLWFESWVLSWIFLYHGLFICFRLSILFKMK